MVLDDEGRIYLNIGETIIFPFKNCRDWNQFYEDWKKENTPKTWDELSKKRNNKEVFICPGLDKNDELIYKSSIAYTKILQLIDKCYGGIISNEEWKSGITKYCITCAYKIYKIEAVKIKQVIAFHTEKQIEEFMSYPENMQLLKDYFMIED